MQISLVPISLLRISLLRFLKTFHKYLPLANFGLFISLAQFFVQNIWLMQFFGHLFHYWDLPYANFGLFISLLRPGNPIFIQCSIVNWNCHSVGVYGIFLNLWQNNKGQIFVCHARQNDVFYASGSWEKGHHFGKHDKQISGPSYFVRAL